MNVIHSGVVMVALLCAGCSSEPIMKSNKASEKKAGVVYGLPKGQVQLDVVRKIVTEDDVKAATKAAESAKATLDAAQVRLKEAKADLDAAQHDVDALKKDNNAAEKDKLEFKLVLATIKLRARTAEVEVAKTQLSEATKDLAKAQANINKLEQKVSLKTLPVVADANHRYVAWRQSSLIRDDKIKLSVSNGLLNTTLGESAGQAGNTLVTLASAVAGARAKAGSTLLMEKAVKEPKIGAQDMCQPYARTWIFDPTDQTEIKRLAKEICDDPQSLIVLTQPRTARDPKAPQEVYDGLAYRVPATVTVEVQLRSAPPVCEVSNTDSYVNLTTTVPDSSATYYVGVDGSLFTKTKTDLVFKDGMLVSYDSDQPSQALAVARIPIDILKAIIEVPASILKLQVDYDSQAEALIKERADLLKAQVDLINAQKTLDEARQGP